MPSLSRLRTDEFYVLYTDIAHTLGEQLGLTSRIDYPCLVATHAAWLNEMSQYLDLSTDPRDEQWDHALAVLAVDLCGCECIGYRLARAVTGTRRIYQGLLLQFPAIYTGLQFVRTQHLELRIKNSSVVMDEQLSRLSHEGLLTVLMSIRQDHRVAANFVTLLDLQR
jgi:hypothetical protein